MQWPCSVSLRAETRRHLVLLTASLLLTGCNEGADMVTPLWTASPRSTVVGTVLNSATSEPVAGAEMSVGSATTHSDVYGRFELTQLDMGPTTLRSTASGFEDFTTELTLASGITTQDISLTPRIKPSAAALALEPESQVLHMGHVGDVSATLRDASGRTISTAAATFTSDDWGVASVEYDQLCAPGCRDFVYVIGVGPGTATIIGEYGGLTTTATVTVLPAFGSVRVDPAESTIAVGGQLRLTATVLDPNGKTISNSPMSIGWGCPDCEGGEPAVTLGPPTAGADAHHIVVTGVAEGTATLYAGPPGPLGAGPGPSSGVAVITVGPEPGAYDGTATVTEFGKAPLHGSSTGS